MAEVRNWALVNSASGVVENTVVWDGETEWSPPEGFVAIQSDIAGIGWTYADGVFTPPPVIPPTPAEILYSQSVKLSGLKQLAEAQKTALTKRISTLQDAIDNVGIEGMEEFAATPDEQIEFPKRKTQLTQWKNYAILLGRVTAQSGWYETVVWPAQPAEGMDLTVSAAAPETV